MTNLSVRPILLGVLLAGATDATELPHYDRVLLLETTSETSANASFGDLDGDGHLDIVLAKGRHWPLVNRVLLGDGKGGIRGAYDIGAASDKSYSGRVVDLDGDGDLDVVVSNDAPSPKLVYINDGRGRFVVGSEYGKPEWPMRNATVADMNGDGLPDIIAANRYGRLPGSNYICLNRGAGHYDGNCIAFSPEPTTTITAADFNRDGILDLLVPHRNGGQSRLYLGAKGADLTRLRSVPFGPPDAQIRIAAAADLNGDGAMDVVAIDETKGVAVYEGKGDATFAAPRAVGAPSVIPYALVVGDPNCDGQTDFIVGNVEARSTVYFNDGGGRRFTPVPFGDTRGTVYGIDIGDFDEDGRPDLAVAKSDAPNAVYFGSGAITCARPTSSSARSATPGARITPSSPSRAATQQDDERRRIDPPGLAPLVPAYSVAIRDGDLVFVSGMTGVKPGTQDIVEGGIAAQTRQTLTNIRTALTAAGATMAEVGECTVYLVDMTDYAAMNAVYIEFFPQAPPSRATVAVSALPRPTARVEIKCSARARRPSR